MQVSREEKTLIESMTPEEASGRFKAFRTSFTHGEVTWDCEVLSLLLGCFLWSNESEETIARPCGVSHHILKAN